MSQGILELTDLRKPTARMAVQYRRPQLLKKSLAASSPFSVFRASPPRAEMAWPAAGSSRRKMAQRLGAQRAHGMGQRLAAKTVGFVLNEKQLLHQWGLD
jgi:hypothetical protein